MKKLLVLAAIACLSSMTTMAQDKVLMTINGDPIMASEFMYIYEKNNRESTIEQKTMDEYLDLFINFKLKVKEAEAQGIDTTEAFLKELKGYRAQATPKYMRDQQAIDSLTRMSYDRMAHIRRAAHIVVECHADASDSAYQAALAKINTARERIAKGEDFFAVANEISEDPSIKENGAELGWITPFRYVYPFENAVYTTPVGHVTDIFRSGFGLHIALVEEERATEEVRAQHIMKMVPRGNEEVAAEMKVVIDSIYDLLAAGADFAETAKALSDDKGSAVRGGELGWFGRGQMVKPFEDAAFAMTDSNEVCKPIRSQFGWHIIRLEGKRGMRPYEEMKEEIEKRVQRDERMKAADRSFIEKTKKEYNLNPNTSDEAVREYADAHLEEKYEDLRNLVREYHDGILLFDVSLAEVWDKAGQDHEGLTRYFKAHKKDFKWEQPKFKGYLVHCKNKTAEKATRTIIKSAEKDSVEAYLNNRLNLDSTVFVKAQYGLWEKGKNVEIDQYGFKVKGAKAEVKEDLPIVFVVGKVLKDPEEYTDERGKVTTAYQDELEKIWVEGLRKKYEVVVNHEVFESLKK